MIPNPNLAAGSGSASSASAAPASGSYPMSAPPAATASSSSDSSGYSASASPNQYGQYGSSSSAYNQYGSSSSSAAYNQYTSAPAQYTPPPQSEAMPYESFMSGGYKSMDCGYGYTKGSDGSCMSTQSWVRISHPEISHAIQFMRSNHTVYYLRLLSDVPVVQVRNTLHNGSLMKSSFAHFAVVIRNLR